MQDSPNRPNLMYPLHLKIQMLRYLGSSISKLQPVGDNINLIRCKYSDASLYLEKMGCEIVEAQPTPLSHTTQPPFYPSCLTLSQMKTFSSGFTTTNAVRNLPTHSKKLVERAELAPSKYWGLVTYHPRQALASGDSRLSGWRSWALKFGRQYRRR
jgi:hypothetical protein